MNERPSTSPTSRSRLDAVGQHRAGRDRVSAGCPARGRSRCRARRAGRPSSAPRHVAQRAGDAADEPVAAERHRRPRPPRRRRARAPGRGRGRGSCSVRKARPRPRSAASTSGRHAGGAAAAGGRVDEQGDLARARAATGRSSGAAPAARASVARRVGDGATRPRARVAASAAARSVDAGEDEGAVEARARGARDVGVEAVADHQRAPGAETVERGAEELRPGLPTVCGLARRWRSRPRRGPRRSRATARRASGYVASRPAPSSVRAAQRRPGWPSRSSCEVEAVVAGDDDDVGPRSRRSVPLTIRRPAASTWRWTRGDADDVRARAVRRSASTCWSAPPTVTTSSSDACSPRRQSLRTNSSPPWRASLVTNATPLPAARRAATASAAPRRALVADPDAAVEVEQHVVVAVDEERRARGPVRLSCRPCAARPPPSPCCSPRSRLAACGKDDERRPPATTASTPATTAAPAATAAGPTRTTAGAPRGDRARRAAGRAGPLRARRRPGPRPDLHGAAGDQLRRDRIRLDVERAPKTARVVRVPRPRRLLRRPDLPPDRPARLRRSRAATRSGTGKGGPGYSVVEAPPRRPAYTRGVVAMAKSQVEDPGHLGQPVLHRHRRGRRAAARVRARRQVVGGPSGGRSHRRRDDRPDGPRCRSRRWSSSGHARRALASS